MPPKLTWNDITDRVVSGVYDTDGGGNSEAARTNRRALRQQIVTMRAAAVRMAGVSDEITRCLKSQVATQEDLAVLLYWQSMVSTSLESLSTQIADWGRVRFTQSDSAVKKGDIAKGTRR